MGKNSHNTTSSSATRITSLERIGVTALTEIIGTLMNDNSSANNGMSAEKRNVLVYSHMSADRATMTTGQLTREVHGGSAVTVALGVSEITDVSLIV